MAEDSRTRGTDGWILASLKSSPNGPVLQAEPRTGAITEDA